MDDRCLSSVGILLTASCVLASSPSSSERNAATALSALASRPPVVPPRPKLSSVRTSSSSTSTSVSPVSYLVSDASVPTLSSSASSIPSSAPSPAPDSSAYRQPPTEASWPPSQEYPPARRLASRRFTFTSHPARRSPHSYASLSQLPVTSKSAPHASASGELCVPAYPPSTRPRRSNPAHYSLTDIERTGNWTTWTARVSRSASSTPTSAPLEPQASDRPRLPPIDPQPQRLPPPEEPSSDLYHTPLYWYGHHHHHHHPSYPQPHPHPHNVSRTDPDPATARPTTPPHRYTIRRRMSREWNLQEQQRQGRQSTKRPRIARSHSESHRSTSTSQTNEDEAPSRSVRILHDIPGYTPGPFATHAPTHASPRAPPAPIALPALPAPPPPLAPPVTESKKDKDIKAAAAAGTSICTYTHPLTGVYCGTFFYRPYDLQRHRETIHAKDEARAISLGHMDPEKALVWGKEVDPAVSRVEIEWQCTVCEALFSRKDALLRHRRLRTH